MWGQAFPAGGVKPDPLMDDDEWSEPGEPELSSTADPPSLAATDKWREEAHNGGKHEGGGR